MVPLNLSALFPCTMNSFLLTHFIQRISAYSSRCPGTSESGCNLDEYDIDVSFAPPLQPYPD